MPDGFGVSGAAWAGVIATLVTLLVYAGATRLRPADADDSRPPTWNPLYLTRGIHGRASLSNLQVLFFTLVVFWILVYWLLRTGELGSISETVLGLLGITALGTAGARVTAVNKGRLDYENWAWLRNRGWIKRDIGPQRRPPRWTDLIASGDAFDAFKFQSLLVTALIGLALLYAGASTQAGPEALAAFEVDARLLGLLGLSQTAYVGAKAVGTQPAVELNALLTTVRERETGFRAALRDAWNRQAPAREELAAAEAAAPEAFHRYADALRRAAAMVGELTGVAVDAGVRQPALTD
jgi:hypothetical protein